MKAVILAGGKGTRMGELTREIPKPMLPIGGIPVLEHQIKLLKWHGITEVIIVTNHLSEVIETYFKENPVLGVNIVYFKEEAPLGTTGGLKEIEDLLDEDFILMYGDVMLDMDLGELISFHKSKRGIGTLVLHPNDHPHDSDLVEINNDKRVTAFHSKPHESGKNYKNCVNAALYVLSPQILKYIEKGVKADFGKDLFPKIIGFENIYGYNTAEYLKDMGTPERIEKVNKDYCSGKIGRLNKKNKRQAVFIDRDGVVNEGCHPGLYRVEDFKLLPKTGEAIKKLNATEYLVILITNQPVIAKNLCSINNLEEIHKKMETLLGYENAKFDAIYYCPHHPDKGYPEERPEYKIDCDCRKPKIGMLKQAEKDFNIDLEGSFFIGDSFRDILCGKNAGVTTIGVRTGDGCRENYVGPDYFFNNLNEAADFIVENPYAVCSEKIKDVFSKYQGQKPFVISLGGNARSGKSTFSKYLAKELMRGGKKVLVIPLDNWIMSKEGRKEEHTVYDRFQLDNIYKSMEGLLLNQLVVLNQYDVLTRQKTNKELQYQLNGEDIVIIEGVVALSSEKLRNLTHLKIFCEIPGELRKERVSDFYAWKGLSEIDAERIFESRKLDEYALISEEKKYADVIIRPKE